MDIDEVSEEIKEAVIIDDGNIVTTNESTEQVDCKPDFKNEIDNFKSEDQIDNHANFNMLSNILSSNIDYGSIIKEGQNSDISDSIKNLGSLEFSEAKEHIENSQYDTYTDDKNQIYKKYRLRENRKKPNYRIPTVSDLPQECDKIVIKRETVKCPQCNQKYESCSELRKHMRRKHKITYTCLLCKQMFDTNAELINHKKVHAEENPMYLCHKCKEAFSDHCDFLLHELTHSNMQKYTCPECGYLYHKKVSYEIHIVTHFNRPLKCPICSKEVNGEFYLKQHIKQHSNSIKCVECEHVFNDTSSYKHHMDIHTGVKMFQCLYCGKGFRLSQQRIVHTRIHTQEALYSCTKCDKKFKQKIDLDRHCTIKHDPEKRLKCNVCSKKFRVKLDLAAHMRVHAKEYECPECHKKLSSHAGLKVHILYVHTTERPESCNLCNKQFINKNQLQKHCRSKMHKNNQYKLNITGEE